MQFTERMVASAWPQSRPRGIATPAKLYFAKMAKYVGEAVFPPWKG